MSQKDKRRHLFKVFVKSKALFACFSIALSLLLVVGSTYAWITSSDERINRNEGNYRRVSAIIIEDFNRVFQWAPGTTKEKNIRVKNTGELPTIVRVSLTEFFVGFETDVTDNHGGIGDGNGNLKAYGVPTTAIKVNDTSTWKKGNTYEQSATKFYKADKVLTNQKIVYNGTRAQPLPSIALTYQAGKVFDSTVPPGTTKYWYYEKGYFYYSEVLKPGEETENLLDSVSLSAEYANQYKGALYKLVPEMEAHDLTKSLLDDWGLVSTDYAYSLYQGKLAK